MHIFSEKQIIGMDVSDERNLKVLEKESSKLKKLLASMMFDNSILKDTSAKATRAAR